MKKHQLVLVVNGQQETLGMLTRTLELEGYDVAVANDGNSALALLEKHKPDLIILDTVMPELDGFQVLNLIRQRSNVPIIMLAGKREMTSAHRALNLGADDYVRKPFSTHDVVARVKAKLRRAKP